MLKRLLARRPSVAAILALAALFVALGGPGYAATGGNFILGNANTADATSLLSGTAPTAQLRVVNNATPSGASAVEAFGKSPTAALRAFNSGTGPALSLSVGSGVPPFTTNSATKVGNLNADQLDGLDSTNFLRPGQPITSGAITATAPSGNGVQGTTSDPGASGVYGQNLGGAGYGVAGRAGASGIGVLGDNTGSGWAGFFTGKVHLDGALDCNGCVGSGDVAAGSFAAGGVGDWAVKYVHPETELTFCSCGWQDDGTYYNNSGNGTVPTDVSSITLPQGVWKIDVFADVYNHASDNYTENRRLVMCGLAYSARLYKTEMWMYQSVTAPLASSRTVILGPGGGTVPFQCLTFDSYSVNSGHLAGVRAQTVNFNATRLANYVAVP